MAEFDDLDGLDDLGDLGELTFDDTNPILEAAPLPGAPLPGAPQPGAPQPAAPQPGAPQPAAPQPAAPAGGLGAVIYDLIAKKNYQQVIQIAESQKSAIEQDPQAKALVENAKVQLQKEAQIQSYLEGARQAVDAGQPAQAQPFIDRVRELDPSHPDLASFAAPPTTATQPMAALQPDPPAPQPGAPQPAAPQPAAPDLLSIDDPEPLSFDDFGALPELEAPSLPAQDPFALGAPQPGAPQPGAPQPGVPQPGAPQPATADFPPPADAFPEDAFAMPPAQDAFAAPPPAQDPFAAPPPAQDAFAAPLPAQDPFAAPPPAEDAFAAPPPAEDAFAAPPPAQDAFADPGDFGDLSLDAGTLPEGFEPAGFDAPAPDPTGAAPGADRIPDLIEEGKAQFAQAQYQAAIDTWSRIFLIDIDHAEASQLIEQAQNKKAELERQAEELFHTALDQIEQEQLEEAKGTLARVLELQPTHTTAAEYLEQLQAGQVPVVSRAPAGADLDLLDDGGLGAFDTSDLAAASGIGDDGQSMEAAVARDRVVVVKKTDKKLVGIAAVVGFLLLAGGGFLALKWNDLFPNAPKAQAPAKKQLDPIDRATKMFEAGKIENAVLLLEKITPDGEDFEEAQALIAQWKTQIEAGAQAEITGPSPEMVARRNLLLRAAREAHDQGQYIRAGKYFERAGKISPLETADLTLQREGTFALEPLQPQIDKFNEGEYAQILPALWRMRDDKPEDRDIAMLIVDSYYNLALKDLQRSNPKAAAEKLGEALEVDPENEELIRMKLFADTYLRKSPDLLYRIYIKYLPSRT